MNIIITCNFRIRYILSKIFGEILTLVIAQLGRSTNHQILIPCQIFRQYDESFPARCSSTVSKVTPTTLITPHTQQATCTYYATSFMYILRTQQATCTYYENKLKVFSELDTILLWNLKASCAVGVPLDLVVTLKHRSHRPFSLDQRIQ